MVPRLFCTSESPVKGLGVPKNNFKIAGKRRQGQHTKSTVQLIFRNASDTPNSKCWLLYQL